MEDWYNHKLDVVIRLGHLPEDTPRFCLDAVALTHQDIAPRNITIQEGTGPLILIDWSLGGIYPFEQGLGITTIVGKVIIRCPKSPERYSDFRRSHVVRVNLYRVLRVEKG